MKILFINHSASRTGAPIVLLHFLRWLKAHKDVRFDVLTLRDTDLLEEFTNISRTHYFNLEKEGFIDKVFRAMQNKANKSKDQNIRYPLKKLEAIAKNDYDLIYANSVVSVPVASYIKGKCKYGPKLLAHFHELNLTIAKECPNLGDYRSTIDFGIAASQMVMDNLMDNWGFASGRLQVVYEHSEIPDSIAKTSEAFIVGASGQVYWRKGPEFFIMVADYVLKKLPNENIRFQWVGRISGVGRRLYEDDLRKLGIQDRVEFTGVQEQPHALFSNFDVFLMTSKEDPFPLVCIEIGMMGIPMVCFEGATGTEEVLKSVEGTVVPYLDVVAMGERVLSYYKNKHLKIEVGQSMKQIFSHFTVASQSEKLYESIKQVVANEA